MNKTLLFLFLIISIIIGSDYFQLPKLRTTNNFNPIEFDFMIGVRVDFEEEIPDYTGTSGNGKFLSEIPSWTNQYCDGFLVDRPNHDSDYFLSHMKAVSNYFYQVSNQNYTFEYTLIDSVYTLSKDMKEYSQSDTTLGDLFFEGIELAENKIIESIENHFSDGFTQQNVQSSLIVMFHAGIGQDFLVPFLDPTPNDLSSAYIESSMLLEFPTINGVYINHGLLLPETENHIYFQGIENMFWGETDYCDYQIGLTGIFSFLVGYAIGLPPLYNTDTGESGIGIFGLMDHGSNNGRGVIPAPPDAWSRIYMGWVEPVVVSGFETYEIPARHYEDVIYKVPISQNEYFLIENRKNDIFGNTDLIDLVWLDEYNPMNWYDVIEGIIDTSGNNYFNNNQNYNIIESVNNYDIGLPGSGLLIWHITEPTDYSIGINNNPFNRSIHLEEADGAIDIGFENYNPFYDEHTRGWKYDMWYKGNTYWGLYNPIFDKIEFSNDTHPNTKSNTQSNTNISISSIESDSQKVYFNYSRISDMNWLEIIDPDFVPIGGGVIDDTGYVFYKGLDSIYQISNWDIISNKIEMDINSSEGIFALVFDNEFKIIDSDSLDSLIPMGYVHSYLEPIGIDTALAFGDIDLDGLDEILFFDNNLLHCINENGTSINGFPKQLSNPLYLLIVNIDNEEHPEIVIKDGSDLVVLSYNGIEVFRESSVQNSMPMIIPNWEGGSAALFDANRYYLFPYDSSHTYWPMPYGQADGAPLSSGYHFEFIADFDGIPKSKVYNYPNPVTDGETIFRFFVSNSLGNLSPQNAEIKIYNASGRFIESLKKTNLILNEYNEIKWSPENLNAGIYLAEVSIDVGESYLVHVLYLK